VSCVGSTHSGAHHDSAVIDRADQADGAVRGGLLLRARREDRTAGLLRHIILRHLRGHDVREPEPLGRERRVSRGALLRRGVHFPAGLPHGDLQHDAPARQFVAVPLVPQGILLPAHRTDLGHEPLHCRVLLPRRGQGAFVPVPAGLSLPHWRVGARAVPAWRVPEHDRPGEHSDKRLQKACDSNVTGSSSPSVAQH
jgi:hypothetical protein